jgi:hypothetical protein
MQASYIFPYLGGRSCAETSADGGGLVQLLEPKRVHTNKLAGKRC